MITLIMILALGVWANAPVWFYVIWTLAVIGKILFGGRNK